MYDLHSLPICADLTPAILFQWANKAAYSCLKSWEGSVQVSLAALELMAGLSRLHIENISETTPLLLVWSVRLHQPTSSLLPNILPPLFPCPLSPSLFSSFLHSFPRISSSPPDHADCKQAVGWVCQYIEHQAGKEHPQHSRDLHTSIVAAFSTLLTLITLHPYLLGNKVPHLP